MDFLAAMPVQTPLSILKFAATLMAIGGAALLLRIIRHFYVCAVDPHPPQPPKSEYYSPIFGRAPEIGRAVGEGRWYEYIGWLSGVNALPRCLQKTEGETIEPTAPFGDHRCTTLNILFRRLLITADPELGTRFFDDLSLFPDRFTFSGRYVLNLPGQNMVSHPVGKPWRMHRSIVAQSMSPRRLNEYVQDIALVGQELCRVLQPSAVAEMLSSKTTNKQKPSSPNNNGDDNDDDELSDLFAQYFGDVGKDLCGSTSTTIHVKDMGMLLKRVTLTVLCRTVLGKGWNKIYMLDEKKRDVGSLMEAQEAEWRFYMKFVLFPTVLHPFVKYLFPERKEVEKKVKDERALLLNIVRRLRSEDAERRRLAAAQEGGGKRSNTHDDDDDQQTTEERRRLGLDSMAATLALHKNNLHEDDVASELSVLLVAGHETTAHSMTYALYCLGRDAERRRVSLQHVQSVLGEKPIPCPEATYRGFREGNLYWLRAVLAEAMRLFPVVTDVSREASKTVHGFDSAADRKQKQSGSGGGAGYTLRKGDWATFNVWAAGRSKKIWGDDVLEFRPERWLSVEETEALGLPPHPKPVPASARTTWELTRNFGGGQRVCPGRRFAEEESVMLMAQLILAFDFELTAANEAGDSIPEKLADLDLKASVATSPRYPLSFKLTPRV